MHYQIQTEPSRIDVTRRYNQAMRDKVHGADLSQYLFGKAQPAAIDLEEAVLGCLLLEKQAMSDVAQILVADDFYTDAHQVVYGCAMHLYEKGVPIDLLTVTDALRTSGQLELIGGSFAVTELTNRVTSAANVEFYAMVIKQTSLQRSLLKLCTSTLQRVYDGHAGLASDPLQIWDDHLNELMQMMSRMSNLTAAQPDRYLPKALKEIEATMMNFRKGVIAGAPSGLREVDEYIGGFKRGRFSIIAGRPGSGKTAAALAMAMNSAKSKIPVGIIELEMTSTELSIRAIAAQLGTANISYSKMDSGRINDTEFALIGAATEELMNIPLFIDSPARMTSAQIRAKAHAMVARFGIEWLIWDYINITKGDQNQSRVDFIEELAYAGKGMARELDIHVSALAQLNRNNEGRGTKWYDKEPELHDLKSSGALEQAADQVILLHRPDYYTQDPYELVDPVTGVSMKDKLIVKVAKNKMGGVGRLIYNCNIHTNRIWDLGDEDRSQMLNQAHNVEQHSDEDDAVRF